MSVDPNVTTCESEIDAEFVDPTDNIIYDGGDDIVELPTRATLVKQLHPELHQALTEKISDGKPILFMPNDTRETNNAYGQYMLVVYGILLDGTKVSINVTNIPIFFDIRVPDKYQEDPTPVVDHVKFIFEGKKIMRHDIIDIEIITGKPLMGYNANPIKFLRVCLTNLKKREIAIHSVRAEKMETANDDGNPYYRKFIRESGTSMSEWMSLRDYIPERTAFCEYKFEVSYNSIKSLINPFGTMAEQEAMHAKKKTNRYLIKDHLMNMAWDIETYSAKKTGDVPLAQYDTDVVFMICMTFHWKDSAEAIYRVCLTDKPMRSDTRWTTIWCSSQANIIKAFGIVFNHMKPDIISGFNDGDYDWPFIIEKAKQFDLLPFLYSKMSAEPSQWVSTGDNIEKFYVRSRSVKISAEDTKIITTMKFPGFIPIDVRIQFMRLYPSAERSSLNFFLKKENLDSKADMPYLTMFKIYEKGDFYRLRNVAYYCIIDAQRCQDLLLKRNVINEHREFATLAFVNLSDCIFCAGGMKVRNILNAYAAKRNIFCSNISKPYSSKAKDKYPGAYVFHPEKGLENKRPTTGLDFSSLYPNVIITYNICPTTFVENEDDAINYEKNGEDLYEVDFPLGAQRIRGHFIRHRNIPERFGLFPSVLIDLFQKRKRIKAILAPLDSKKELMEKDGNADSDEYRSLEFDCKTLDAKQKAYKIIMNTFYGETGNSNSCFFLVHLAGGVTCGGQYNIRLAERCVLSLGCKIKYGDSVPGYTPVILCQNGIIRTSRIDEIVNDQEWTQHFDKEIHVSDGLYVWELNRFVKVNKIIRHRTDKQILRVVTFRGTVDVTEDHSLITITGEKIKPQDVSHTTKLLHCGFRNLTSQLNAATPDEGSNHCNLHGEPKVPSHILSADIDIVRQYYRKHSIDIGNDTKSEYALGLFLLRQRLGLKQILASRHVESIMKINSESEYVYDLETETQRFHAGVGSIVVHNTDSLYIICPDDTYVDADKKFEDGTTTKKEYWEDMVRLTLDKMDTVNEIVNAKLEEDNGSKYLKMVREEVLFPSVFAGKKKYCGHEHKGVPNFDNPSLFMRGIEIKKRGQTGIAKRIGSDFINATLSMEQTNTTLSDIVIELLDKAIDEPWTIDDFVQTDVWKPNKQNVAVQNFVARQRARNKMEIEMNAKREENGVPTQKIRYVIPEPGERFEYVIVKCGAEYTNQGKKLTYNKGDCMELKNIADEFEMEINLLYYLVSYVSGLCARFINYEPQFQPEGITDMKKIDAHSQRKAKSFLVTYIKEKFGSVKGQGTLFKRAWKDAVPFITRHLQTDFPKFTELFIHPTDNLMDIFTTDASNFVIKYETLCAVRAKEIFNKLGTRKRPNSQLRLKMLSNVQEKITAAREEMCDLYDVLASIVTKFKAFEDMVVFQIRNQEEPSVELSFDTNELEGLDSIYHNLSECTSAYVMYNLVDNTSDGCA